MAGCRGGGTTLGTAGTRPAGFRRAGRGAQDPADAARAAPGAARAEELPGRHGPLPGASEIGGQPSGEAELGVGHHDQPKLMCPARRHCGAPRPTHVAGRPCGRPCPQRMKPSPGIGLGRPVQRMLQGTDRIQTGSSSGGTRHAGTHRAPPSQHDASTKQRPFPHRRLCCPPGSTGTTAASDTHPARGPLPEVVGYRTRRFRWHTPQASRDATDRSVASPTGLVTLGFDPARCQTGPPACYRASWQLPGPDSHRQATTSLRPAISYITANLPSPGRAKSRG
jgi:hypothetical protein